MTMTDPIADYLTRIRNGLASDKRWVDVPSSKMKKRISLILKEENYIDGQVSGGSVSYFSTGEIRSKGEIKYGQMEGKAPSSTNRQPKTSPPHITPSVNRPLYQHLFYSAEYRITQGDDRPTHILIDEQPHAAGAQCPGSEIQ